MAIVLGGGISGLSAAYYLLKRFPAGQANVKLFEASNRFGGWIRSETHADAGNSQTIFEAGPRTLRIQGPRGSNTLELCSELSLQNSILPIKSTSPAVRNRMLFVNGELCSLPSSIFSIFRTKPPFSRPLILSGMQDLQMGAPKLDDDTTYNFVERRFGTEVAKYLISSMLCGICAGDAKEISVKFLMKEWFQMEQMHGSVLRGIFLKRRGANVATNKSTNELVQRAQLEKWSIYSFKGGMKTLSDALVEHLTRSNVELNRDSPCSSIEFVDKQAIVSIGDRKHNTDCLISSLPSYQLAKLIENQHPQLATDLRDIQYVNVVVVNLQYPGELIKRPGFGFLVPPCENLPILGVIFDSCCSETKGKTVLTVMMGGKWYNERLGERTDDELLRIATDQVENILKISAKPEAHKVNVLRECIPQYIVGHSDRIERIQEYIQDHKLPLRLCGSAYDGVGVNDVIYSAKQAVLN